MSQLFSPARIGKLALENRQGNRLAPHSSWTAGFFRRWFGDY